MIAKVNTNPRKAGLRKTHDSGHNVKIERAEKVLFPENGVTKGELIRYYQAIAARMLPYLRGRPLAAERFPDGIGQKGFFQKSVPRRYPDWMDSVVLPKKGGTIRHVVCNEEAALTYLANQACITLHTWLSDATHPEVPRECIIDIDPSDGDGRSAVAAALEVRDLLNDLGAFPYVKTTGGNGLHVHVCLMQDAGYDSVHNFAKELAMLLVTEAPKRYTLEFSKQKREGKIYLDVNRNAIRADRGSALLRPSSARCPSCRTGRLERLKASGVPIRWRDPPDCLRLFQE